MGDAGDSVECTTEGDQEGVEVEQSFVGCVACARFGGLDVHAVAAAKRAVNPPQGCLAQCQHSHLADAMVAGHAGTEPAPGSGEQCASQTPVVAATVIVEPDFGPDHV